MRNRWVTIVIGILLVAVIAILYNKLHNKGREVNGLENALLYKDDSISYYKNQYGAQVAVTKAMIYDIQFFKRLNLNELDSLRKEFATINKNFKNLESLIKVNTEVSQMFKTPLIDTVIIHDDLVMETKGIRYNDEFLNVFAFAHEDTVLVDYTVTVPIKVVATENKHRWKLFGKQRNWLPVNGRSYDAEGTSSNPNAKITGLEFIMLR